MKRFQTRRLLHFASLTGLLFGLVVTGCDEILGIDGFVAGCIENAARCSPDFPNWRQRCDADGRWQNEQPCSTNATCKDGECVECANGDCACDSTTDLPQCMGNAPAYCKNNQWSPLEKCIDQTCVGARCQGECESQTMRCIGNTPQACNELGKWEGNMPCGADEVCIGGSCSCNVGDRRCWKNRPQKCNASNLWVDEGDPCMGQTCVENTSSCVGVCEPEQKQCASANAAQKCGPDGQWQPGEICPLGCSGGTCVACTQGENRCAGNTRQTCGPNGQWMDNEVCIEKTCIAGTCQGQCAPSAKRCSANYPQTCTSNGNWENSGTVCGACVECDSATGICNVDPVETALCTQPTTIETGAFHTCARLPSETMKCWGYNAAGQLGLGDTNDRGTSPGQMGTDLATLDLGPGLLVKDIRAGTSHTCARFSNGSIKCWGKNAFGQLGLGDMDNRGTSTDQMGTNLPTVEVGGQAIAMSAGETHSCAILSNGNVKCWGGNFYGQLGLGDTFARGDQSGEMGPSLPTVDLGNGATAAIISAGDMHTCARLSPVEVKCWGNNFYGQLGLGDTNHRGDQPNEMGANLLNVDLALPAGIIVKDISAGGTHTCVLLSDGTIKCWGNNDFGQLGIGDTNTRGDELGEMGQSLKSVELGLSLGITVIGISAGAGHACALLSNGSVKCWGKNDFGQLGLGDKDARGDEMGEMGTKLPAVDLGAGVTATEIHAGFSHTCALLSSGRVKCWGRSVYGQLGQSDTVTRGEEPSDMGDRLRPVDL